MPPPILGIDIDPGPLPTIPPVAVTTLENAKIYVEACEAWRTVGQEGMNTAEDVVLVYGPALTEEVTCSWALYGWPAESQLMFEKDLNRWAGYTDKLRIDIQGLKEQLLNRYQAIQDFNKERIDDGKEEN
jgi:hypothetical protein